MRPADVRAVASLHHASLHGLLTELGPATLRAYYGALVGAPLATAFVARDGNAVCGFVVGSTAPATLKQTVVKRRPLAIGLGIALGVLRRPSSLGWLVRSFRGPDEGSYDARAAELTYIAVSPETRGSGVGAQLVHTFAGAMHRAGATHFELSVDDDNTAAARFYERHGFVRAGRYREFGVWHVRYRRTLGAADGPTP